ncbi:bacteriophage protein [uncultured phage MedDCM-OCT-S01-C58]|nr:bacteriophage protein [uncultured phage MedDCM-OCT-S01-C58]BAR24299.1 phage-related protein tail component-like protein [uncultured Mediterranean phage uvMED]
MALNSESSIKLIDLLCEGPIEGLVNNSKSIFLDETSSDQKAVKSSDFAIRKGTANQTRIGISEQFANATTTIIAVDTQVGENYSEEVNENNEVVERKYGAGLLVKTITDPKVNFVKLLFTIPKLFSTAVEGLARGQLFPAAIRIRIAVKSKNSGFNTIAFDGQDYKEFRGISTSNYQYQTPRIDLTGEGPWQIKVKKLRFTTSAPGPDAEQAFEIKFSDLEDVSKTIPLANGRGDTIVWSSIIAGTDIKTAYKHTACVGLSLSTDQFNTVPARAYEIKGMKVQIPSSAMVRADGSLDYSGNIPFNGKLLSRTYTTCPVCCFYDMVTNSRYGAGDFVTAEELSWVDLIELSKYCNELVPTSAGGTEPRFAINTVIASPADAFSVLQDLASVFRGMIYWKSDTIQVAGDHGVLGSTTTALEPVHLFTNSNVVGGGFSYNGASLKTRSTRVRVRYNDPNNFYRPDFVVIENKELVNKYGFQIREIVAFGCTSKFQAQRMGKWVLASEETEGETVTFSVGLEGLMVMPGQIFAVSDAMRQGARLAGRISASTTTSVTADQTITLPAGTSPELSCVLADGTTETKAISGVVGNVINVSSAFSSAPQVETVYSIQASNVKHQKFRCLAIGEGENGTYSITGVQHVDNIYNVVETENALLEFADVTLFDEAPPTPVDLSLDSTEVTKDGVTTTRITASWSRGSAFTAIFFKVKYKVGDGNFVEATTTNTNFSIENVPPTVAVEFFVRAVGPAPRSKESADATARLTVPVSPLTPPDPASLSLELVGRDQVCLRWVIGETGINKESLRAVIRHTTDSTANATWADTSVMRVVLANSTFAILPRINGTYFVKFQTILGARSLNAVAVTLNLPNSIPRFNYETIREDVSAVGLHPFLGQGFGAYYDSEYDGLVLDGDAKIDDIAGTFDDLTSVDFIGTRGSSGVYHFEKILDLGGKFSVELQRVLTSRGLYPLDTVDSRTALIDTWSDIDGAIADDTTADVYFRTTDQATAGVYFLTEDDDYLLFGGDVIAVDNLVAENGDQLIGQNGDVIQTNQANASVIQILLTQNDDTLVTQDGDVLVSNVPESVTYTIDERIATIDTWNNFDNYDPNAAIPLPTAEDKIYQESNLTFGPWTPLENGEFVARQFQFKAELTALHPDQTPIVDKLGAVVQFERRTENSNVIASGLSGNKIVTFDNEFYVDDDTRVAVSLSPYDMQSGDFYTMSVPTSAGFAVAFRNAQGEIVNRQFQYAAIGYGTKQA